MKLDTIPSYLKLRAAESPDDVWLRDLKNGKEAETWTWSQAESEVLKMAAVLEKRFRHGDNMVILSRNRAHWVLADNAIIASGNVAVSMFTTLTPSTAEYVFDFTQTSVIFVGEAENWQSVREVLPKTTVIISLPGVEIDGEHLKWADLLKEAEGLNLKYECKPDDLVSLVFTSGTTGVPKGVMQTHATNLIPMLRVKDKLEINEQPRFLSYLPLSHIAERQMVEFASMIHGGVINFNENLTHPTPRPTGNSSNLFLRTATSLGTIPTGHYC